MIHVPELLREDVSVASSWFSSQGLYNDAWTNIHQIAHIYYVNLIL